MPVEDVQESFSRQVDASRHEEDSNKQAENQTEFPEETNLLLLMFEPNSTLQKLDAP